MTPREVLAIVEKEGLDAVLARGDSVKIGTVVYDRNDIARLRREPIPEVSVMTNKAGAPKKAATAKTNPTPQPKDELASKSHEELGEMLKSLGQAVPSKKADRIKALRDVQAGKAPETVPGETDAGGE